MSLSDATLNQPPIDGQPWRWSRPWHLFFNSLKGLIFGSGTADYITKFTDTFRIGNSALTEDKLQALLRDYDEEDPTTDAQGDITQILYKRSAVTKLTEVRAYNIYKHILTQVFTGEWTATITHSYLSDNKTWDGQVIT